MSGQRLEGVAHETERALPRGERGRIKGKSPG
jgi:hypothetical protein